MFYRRKSYRVRPEQVAPFTAFFTEYLLPNQLKHGARLVGRWVTEAGDEIVALWEYDSREAYERIEAAVRADPMAARAQARRKELGDLFLESRQDFLSSTVHVNPMHIVSAAACITNDRGEVLLVRNHHRADTWEMPGGQVEVGEPPHQAAVREVWEETGIEVRLHSLVGLYFSEARDIVNLVFRGEAIGGAPRTAVGETQAVGFFPPDEALAMITRPYFRTRLEDALAGWTAAYESFRQGYERERLDL